MEKLEQLKVQINDLLNQIVILTKDLPKPQTLENYNYQMVILTEDRFLDELSDNEITEEDTNSKAWPIDGNGEPLKKPNDLETALYCISRYAQRVLQCESNAVRNENQYYTSNC